MSYQDELRQFVKKVAKKQETVNFKVGKIAAINGKAFTVTIDSGSFTVPNVSGLILVVGDWVSIRLRDGDINKAEIAGITTGESAEIEEVWI